MNIFNVRFGLATNSSSSHSLIFLKEGQKAFDFNGYVNTDLDPEHRIQHVSGKDMIQFGWQFFTVASNEAKINYLGILLRHRLYENLPKHIADLICRDWLDGIEIDKESYIDHQSRMFLPNEFNSNLPDQQFFKELKDFLLQEQLLIIGGNDNEDTKHPLDNNESFELPIPRDINNNFSYICRKDEKYNFWTLFCPSNGTKIRFSFSNKKEEIQLPPEKASSPELVDIKITDFCPYGCEFCYQASTQKGQHANSFDIHQIAKSLSTLKVFEVAIGGGEPTLHPEFERILEHFNENGIVANFTTKNLNWLRDPKKWIKWLSLSGAFAYSATNANEIKELNSILEYNGIKKDKATVHLVMGSFDKYTFESLLRCISDCKLSVTLLGFKKIGNGLQYSFTPYGWWIEIIKKLINEHRIYINLSIDTVLAKEFEKEIINAGVDRVLFTVEDGKFSCYIDAVAMKIGPSSYCENDKMILLEDDDEYFLDQSISSIFNTF